MQIVATILGATAGFVFIAGSAAMNWMFMIAQGKTVLEGFAGSRSWDPIQATPPRSMITRRGILQTMSSMRPEKTQLGR